MKALGLTEESLDELLFLRQVGVHGTLGGAVECVDIKRNAGGESDALGLYEVSNAIHRGWNFLLTLRCESQGSERD